MSLSRFHVDAKKVGTTGELQLYGDIGPSFWGDGISDKTVAASLKTLENEGAKDLHVYINSVGGNVFHGITIYNQIKRWSNGKKHIYVDGLAASIASIISMAGDEIHMGTGSQMMIHEPSGGGRGKIADLEKTAEMMRQVRDNMTAIYVAKTGLAESEIRSMMAAETWMKPSEAVAKKFATDIVDDSTWANATTAQMRIVATASPLYASYRNVPDELKAFLASMPENPAQPRNPEENKKMDFLKIVAKALGLSESATEAEVIIAITNVRARAGQADAVLASAHAGDEIVALTGKSNPSEAKGTILAWKNSHEKMGTYEAERALRDAQEKLVEVNAIVAKACVDGQITPAMKEFWIEQGKKDPQMLKTFVASAAKGPGVIADPVFPKPTDPSIPSVALLVPDDEQEKMFKVAGITDEKMKAQIRAEVAAQTKDLHLAGIKLPNQAPANRIKGM